VPWELNADVGEGFPYDAELLTVIDAANVACGFHAGDDETMSHVCRLAVRHGVTVGAQPSYRDREGFGRRDLDVTAEQLLDDLREQLAALTAIAASVGCAVSYVKPHGALYNRTVWDAERAGAVVQVAAEHGLPVLGLPGSRLLAAAAEAGLGVWREFFADRGYTPEGRLVPRTEPGAVITDPSSVTARVRRLMSEGVVVASDGTLVPVEADSICVHGDSPGALELARAVRAAIDEETR
jgi:5-oxoprolinase (ATP-hydrolysing) subunit A